MKTEQHPVYNLRFGLICLSSLFFSASYNMLIPELPSYLSSLGGAEYKGLIISLFTLTAGLSRPFSGKLADSIGRKPVMIVGTLVCVVCGLLYPVLGTVIGFLLLRLFHGFSTGFTPTAISAYVSDIIPPKKWGEALGFQGLFFSTGLALGPALGSLIKSYYSFSILFYCSSIIGVLAFVLMGKVSETLSNRQTFSFSILKISKKDIIAPEVLAPACIVLLSYLSFGVILTIIPDWSDFVGVSNKGLFFIVFTISSLSIRFVAGKISDIHGRVPVIIIGLIVLLVSLIVIGYYHTVLGLMVGAAIYGLAMGILSPALNAWTIDMSIPNQKGKAIATMYIALEIGIGFGALCSGWYFQNTIINVPTIFYTCSIITMIAIAFMLFRAAKQVKISK